MLKSLVKSALRARGLEVRPVGTAKAAAARDRRGRMTGALDWASSAGFSVNTVLDVGASDGQWSAHSLAAFPRAAHLLFEPQPVHSEALDRFIAARGEAAGGPKIAAVKKAVGAEVGKTYFDNTDPLGGALMDSPDGPGSVIEVPLTTVDAAVAEHGASGPFLLKLDTHGFEKGILEGSAETLKHAELLIIEAYNYHVADGSWLFWELCAHLAGEGFRPVDVVDLLRRDADGSLWQMDIVFARDTWAGFQNNAWG